VELASDRRYRYPFSPGVFWQRIQAVPEYPRWWPWLRSFDGTRLAPGEMWACVVQPPLPYRVAFTVAITDVVDGHVVAATVNGDIRGRARLIVEPTDEGCEVSLISTLGPDRNSLRALSIAARPFVRFGHNWVLDTGARQFGSRASE
jgi:hypothetical protein